MGELIYLDNSATSFPKPEEVYAFMDGFYRSHGVNPGRSGFDLGREAGEMVDDTRRLLTELFGGSDPNRLCFGSNATDALNLVISGLLEPGDHVITTNLEHNSVLRPLHHMQQRGVEVDHVPCDAAGFVDPDAFERRFKPNTRLVVVNHASNVIGTIQPVREIGARCRAAGVPFVLDASQSAGVLPIDIEALNVDIVVFTGHKALMGPTGTGGLYVRDGIEIAFSRAGGTGVRSAVRGHLEEYPYRLEYGTPNLLGIAGLNAGVRWVQAQGIQALHEREMRLCTLLRDGILEIEGVTTYCQDDLTNHIAVLAFNIEGFEAGATSPLFDVDHDVACRTGLHCAPLVHEHLGTTARRGAIRFSLGPFNTVEHVERAIAAVASIASMRNAATQGRDEAGAHPPVNEKGFLVDPGQWNEEVALWLAREEEGLAELGRDHWKVLHYVRGFWKEHDRAPMVRYLCKSTGLKLKTIYELFPSGPADGACKLAGLPNADGCV